MLASCRLNRSDPSSTAPLTNCSRCFAKLFRCPISRFFCRALLKDLVAVIAKRISGETFRGQFRFCSRAGSSLPSAHFQGLETPSGLRIGAAGPGFPKFLISPGMQIFMWVLYCKSQPQRHLSPHLHGGKFFPLLSSGDFTETK